MNTGSSSWKLVMTESINSLDDWARELYEMLLNPFTSLQHSLHGSHHLHET
jgi:hypothetical protein